MPSLSRILWRRGPPLQVQIVTGIVLAMHYTPHVVCAGVSIEHILREVYGGWLLRHAHANGASLFFLAVYLHLYRGLAMGHAWRVFVWCVGVLLLLLSVLTAFVGYVLPWRGLCRRRHAILRPRMARPILGDHRVWLDLQGLRQVTESCVFS